jgi:hypothetical protein
LQQAAAALERACLAGAHDAEIDDLVREVSRKLTEAIDAVRAETGPTMRS